jgi:hypothetical protein
VPGRLSQIAHRTNLPRRGSNPKTSDGRFAQRVVHN